MSLYRVMLANTKELIEMQTRNDSTDPRSGLSFYEKYHSLEDVGPTTLTHPKTPQPANLKMQWAL